MKEGIREIRKEKNVRKKEEKEDIHTDADKQGTNKG